MTQRTNRRQQPLRDLIRADLIPLELDLDEVLIDLDRDWFGSALSIK